MKNQGIYQNNNQISLKNKEVVPAEPVQINIYQSNTYGKDLSWVLFNNKPRVQERQQVKDQQSCIFVFVAYPTRTTSQDMTAVPCMAVWQIYRDTKEHQQKETSQNESRLQFCWMQFFLIGIYSMQDPMKKKHKKEISLERTYSLQVSVNSRPKAIQINKKHSIGR